MPDVPDYSIGFTLAEVEAIFAANKAELSKMIASHSDGGTTIVKRQMADINATIRACQKALQKLDPTTYGKRRRIALSGVNGGLARL